MSARARSNISNNIIANINILLIYAKRFCDLRNHAPYLSAWRADSESPRPTLWTDLKYLWRRNSFLHRGTFDNLVKALRRYTDFAKRAQFLLEAQNYDLRRLEILTWTYAEIAKYAEAALGEAWKCQEWSLSLLNAEVCNLFCNCLNVLGAWLKDLEASGGQVCEMIEVAHLERLRREFKENIINQNMKLADIAAEWEVACGERPERIGLSRRPQLRIIPV
ncbi:hypothetical protein CERZMDRAFT_99430 [Cercospora zeae-maydis SCOH1-5]|uniref:Uncharacterized protein n=1 Tax=Cercospora zeae-maydis SCOH1-5 TaxID=717836 RepID=A0A6A6FAG8_9PEZI|nr:hypothetical protein CERZMDRAFT_99430 [Cercospora zeae-maydis SCOH1-5]